MKLLLRILLSIVILGAGLALFVGTAIALVPGACLVEPQYQWDAVNLQWFGVKLAAASLGLCFLAGVCREALEDSN